MRFFSLVCVLPAVDDHQLTLCVERQHIAQTGKQSIVLLNRIARHILATTKQPFPSDCMTSTVQRQYSYEEVQLCLPCTV